ncbi:hypothetical protein P389DRAFT_168371 [Cystobasidium minutum MCA 4210]|uniref:uncharacterized protein n=1 Tax=Cystobasidium minutum MCA 4210 TaxID=1397322 RepID=UPI0034CE78CF|eukprot:jgi/Rhomi1/168371/fgenesh1_kg.2_\
MSISTEYSGSTQCMHCRARSYSSTLMDSRQGSPTTIHGRMSSSSSLPSMAASFSRSIEEVHEGYFSFQSVGLLEPEVREQPDNEHSKVDQEGRTTSRSRQSKTATSRPHVKQASRSNSFSRLLDVLPLKRSNTVSYLRQSSSRPRTRAAHPFSVSSSSSNRGTATTAIKRPSLLDTVKMKSDPYIDIERMKCERRYTSYYRKMRDGFPRQCRNFIEGCPLKGKSLNHVRPN